jgi:hypothetical protein
MLRWMTQSRFSRLQGGRQEPPGVLATRLKEPRASRAHDHVRARTLQLVTAVQYDAEKLR